MTNCIIETRLIDPRLGKEFPLPHYATAGAAGMDLCACIEQPTELAVGAVVKVNSGVAISIRNPGYMALLTPRSGLGSKHGIVLANTVGVIDSDYQDEIKIALYNRSDTAYTLTPGERVCQMIIVPLVQAQLSIVTAFSEETGRGLGGFGSTGKT